MVCGRFKVSICINHVKYEIDKIVSFILVHALQANRSSAVIHLKRLGYNKSKGT